MKRYDLIVLGSGSGSKITRPAAALGYRVAVIEKSRWGGTCLNRGCIPSKMLIHSADVASVVREASRFDLELKGDLSCRFEELVSRVNETIDAESEAIPELYDSIPLIDRYHGEAKFLENRVVRVGNEKLSAEKIFIAVGARPHLPSIEGLEKTPFMTYIEALRNRKKPKKLLIIGGGYIAAELGHFYSALGVEVEFIVRSRMLKREDWEVRYAFEEQFCKRHSVHLETTPHSVSYSDGEFTLLCRDKQGALRSFHSDALLVATGVEPCSSSLGLEQTDIQTDRNGFILVDDYLETSVKGVWAWGDCIGRNLYRHTANFEGEYLFNQLFQGEKRRPIDYSPIPHAVFSLPQVAGVGKTEDELKREGVDYLAAKHDYAESGMGMALRSEYGFVKLLFDRKTSKLLGAHILGEEAATMIHMPIAYMNMDATLDQMLKTIYIHPALPEVVRNACRQAKRKMMRSAE